MKLPELPIQIQKRQHQIYNLQGINRSDNFSEGTIYDCKNISSRRFPYFTTRYARSKVGEYENATAITSWNKLVVVDGTNLYYDGNVVGQVTAGKKQFAVINTKLVIMPDKKYLDLNSLQLVDMGAKVTLTTQTIHTVAPAEADLTQYLTINSNVVSSFANFAEDDFITVVLGNITYSLQYLKAEYTGGVTKVTFRKLMKQFVTADYTGGTFERKIPDFDFICSSDNRIWGCVSNEQTIYSSALGDPTNFFDYSGESTDSYAVAVGTEGAFTGCHKLGSSVIFFKEFNIHKVVGSYPAEYAVYTYDMDGVKEGCGDSLVAINDTLFYLSNKGVMAYSGGNANKISEELGNTSFTDGVGGTDGEKYYLSCKGDGDNLFVFDIRNGMWLREDDNTAEGFARHNNVLYMIIDKCVYQETKEPLDDYWYVQFNDMFESRYNNYGRRIGTVLQKKMYSKLVIRMETNSYVTIKVRYDEGRWEEVGNIVGRRKGVYVKAVPLNRCDSFGIRFEGHGEFSLLAMTREFMTGSERNE